MSPVEAAQILNLPAGATPEQREAAFRAQRAVLEEKVARAPTEGLKEKYREAIFRLTTARNVLQSCDDGSELPVRRRAPAGIQSASAEPGGSPPAQLPPREEIAAAPLAAAPEPAPTKAKARRPLRSRLPFVILLLVVGVVAWIAWLRLESANAPLVTDPALFMAKWNDPPGDNPPGEGNVWWDERTPRELLHLIGAAFASVEKAAQEHEAKAAELLAEYKAGSHKKDLWRAERWHLHEAHTRAADYLRTHLEPGNPSPQIEEFRRAVVWFDSRLVDQLRDSAAYYARTIPSLRDWETDLQTSLEVTSNPSALTVTIETRFGEGETLLITRKTPVDVKEFLGAGTAEIRVKHPGKPDFVHRATMGGRGWRIHADFIDPRKSDYN